ncbi:MAG: hypothetical protein KAW12_07075 [Candidatus Aminicenantes bacterium]|nr:hypothetical protein [Candidatus Aminicenantes bacterium]
MGEFKFYPDGHRYTYDGQDIPSVTQVLKIFFDFHFMNNEQALRRGTDVHQMIEGFEKGNPDDETIDLMCQYEDHLLYWQEFKKEFNFKSSKDDLIEQRMFSKNHRYAGTLDRVFFSPEPTIIDIKAGVPIKKIHRLQLLAYHQLAVEHTGNKKFKLACVYLKPSGYKVKFHKFDKSDYNVFLSGLCVHNYKKLYKEKVNEST